MAGRARKRPWFLVLALFGALAFGLSGARDGWRLVEMYREPVDPSLAGEGIVDEADREAIVHRAGAFVAALDAAKTRGWPLGVAGLLLGGAMVFFSMRAIGGSGGARAALVQLVVAQAGANAASFWLLRDVREAELRVREATQLTQIRAQDRGHAEDFLRAARALGPIGAALGAIGSALVVVALTRRRSRDFFDAAAEAVEER